jgi:protein-disulfide isomerase-like protein with CxxC motif
MINMAGLELTHFSDPGCPWAWSASPALAVLRWRYGDQIGWRHVMIGLTENGGVYERRGYSPHGQAQSYRRFRGRGMPFATRPRERVHGTWPMCRVVVATRRLAPDREWAVFRALQLAQFTTTLDLEDRAALTEAIAWVPGIDAQAVVAAAADPETEALFVGDRDAARTAAGSPTEFQGKSANYDGRVRYTAPSVVLTAPDGRRLEAGGFQPIEAYDIIVANLDPTLERRAPATEVAEVLPAFPDGLTTMEVAAVMTPNNGSPDRDAAEDGLIAIAAAGEATRIPFGHDALWVPPTRTAAGLAAAA